MAGFVAAPEVVREGRVAPAEDAEGILVAPAATGTGNVPVVATATAGNPLENGVAEAEGHGAATVPTGARGAQGGKGAISARFQASVRVRLLRSSWNSYPNRLRRNTSPNKSARVRGLIRCLGQPGCFWKSPSGIR
jgi:hypothetical protein